MNNVLTTDAANTKPSINVIVALIVHARWSLHIPPHAYKRANLYISLEFFFLTLKHTFRDYRYVSVIWKPGLLARMQNSSRRSCDQPTPPIFPWFSEVLKQIMRWNPNSASCVMRSMQASQRHRKHFRSKTVLPRFTKCLHNAALVTQNVFIMQPS